MIKRVLLALTLAVSLGGAVVACNNNSGGTTTNSSLAPSTTTSSDAVGGSLDAGSSDAAMSPAAS